MVEGLVLPSSRWITAFFLASCWTSAVLASDGRAVDVPERIRGADRIAVATVTSVLPRWHRNTYGDQLIVSQVLLQVEETLKGEAEPTLALDLEGGTLDGVTLHVSDLPELKTGERAVFFLDRTGSSAHVPHLRGLGILKLDGDNRVQGSSLRLADIRQMATAR